MKSYDFLCGGDQGSWECTVTVELTKEESSILAKYAKENEFLEWFPPTDKIYSKVLEALEEQCDEDADLSDAVIWVPFKLRDA